MSWVIRWCAGAKLYEQRFDSELAGRAMVRKKEAPAVNLGKSSMENLRVVLTALLRALQIAVGSLAAPGWRDGYGLGWRGGAGGGQAPPLSLYITYAKNLYEQKTRGGAGDIFGFPSSR